MNVKPLTFYDALAHNRRATDAYRHLSPEGRSALVTRAMRAHDNDEMRLYVLALDAREDAREDR